MALDPITAGIDLVREVVSRVWPDATETDKQKAVMALAELQAQTDINKIEAANQNIWVSGARPFILWICGVAFAYSALLEPLMRFISVVCFGYHGQFPVIDTNLTMQVLLGMLGLGAMRSYDKTKGAAR
jgi:hypothetical protein